MSKPGMLGDLLTARRKVRERYGPGFMNELPVEATQMIVGEFANRTPRLRGVSKELSELAIDAIAAGHDFPHFANENMFGQTQSAHQPPTVQDFLTNDDAAAEMMQNSALAARGVVDEYGRAVALRPASHTWMVHEWTSPGKIASQRRRSADARVHLPHRCAHR